MESNIQNNTINKQPLKQISRPKEKTVIVSKPNIPKQNQHVQDIHTPTSRTVGNKKTSHKNKNKDKPKQQSKTKQIVDNNPNPKVSFNFKNNHVDKFYCHQMAKLKLTKTGPIDLESIPNLPEIPLEQLFGAQ